LIEKWKERGNHNQHQNQNENQNLQIITTEERDDHPSVETVTRGGTRIGLDATDKGKGVEKWIRKEENPTQTFNPLK
jgi:hypothetical protein